MTDSPQHSPKDVFIHLLLVGALYVSAVSFLGLLFQYINVWFPDALNFSYSRIMHAVRWSTAALVITFPVFILISWIIAKDFAKHPAKRELKTRKWLIYFTLFVAAITIIVDLITLVYNFLGGDLSMQFFLKTLAVLIVATGVFGYYFWDLRRSHTQKTTVPQMLRWITSLIVLATIVGSFFVIGTPASQRARRFDEQRVNDLQIVQSQIVNFWAQKDALPETLSDLEDSISGFIPPSDPTTDESYEYTVASPLSFELCALFETESTTLARPTKIRDPFFSGIEQNWEHTAGRVCFDRTIDPDLYDNEDRVPKPLLR